MQTQEIAEGADQRRSPESTEQHDTEWLRGHGAGLNQRGSRSMRRAKGLGWFSVALGLAEVMAPGAIAAVAGAPSRRRDFSRVRLFGIRELAMGAGIFSRTMPAAWLWARVAGDAIDLAALARILASPRSNRARTMTAMASVLGITALDIRTAIDLGRNDVSEPEGIHVLSAITVNRPREEVYQFWRNLENLPKFMAHLESVEVQNGRSKWCAKGPVGITIEWEAEIVTDQANENLAWRSCEGSEVPNQGSVRFLDAPGGRGTEVRVELRYDPPAGALGAAIAKLFGAEPGQAIAGDLRRFKQVIETGEVLHSDASIHSGPHPARPSETSTREAHGSKTRERSSQGRGAREKDSTSEAEKQVMR